MFSLGEHTVSDFTFVHRTGSDGSATGYTAETYPLITGVNDVTAGTLTRS